LKKIIVQKDSYYDSVFLMLINKDVKQFPGVTEAVVSMGTEVNLELLKDMGLYDDEVANATPNDLIIAIEGESEDVLEDAAGSAKKMLSKKGGGGEEEEYRPTSLAAAKQAVPDANMVVISLPGEHAAREVRKALRNDMHVMLFSDNVSLEDEIRLKEMAKEKGLLMMGPDCGTAIINGKPLCFANVVRDGDIGLVGASGTGLQEVSCSIEKFGAGISQAIGTGGRDLKSEKVGGTMMLMGIEALAADPATKVIGVISKPPAESVAKKVISTLEKTGKPCVVHFIGLPKQESSGNVHYAGNLEECAGMCVALSEGKEYKETVFTIPESEVNSLISRETEKMSSNQKFLRGLYTGGTLADEAVILLNDRLGGVHAFDSKDPNLVLKDPHTSEKHTIVDLGEDVFTVGRPHPMIDPSTREDRIKKEANDRSMAVMLLDIVLGYGSHSDPAGAILDSLADAKEKAAAAGGYLSIICSITGTEGDFQKIKEQKRKLESIGCVVMPSNYQASMLALKIMDKVA